MGLHLFQIVMLVRFYQELMILSFDRIHLSTVCFTSERIFRTQLILLMERKLQNILHHLVQLKTILGFRLLLHVNPFLSFSSFPSMMIVFPSYNQTRCNDECGRGRITSSGCGKNVPLIKVYNFIVYRKGSHISIMNNQRSTYIITFLYRMIQK